MKLDLYPPKPWKLSEDDELFYSKGEIEENLNVINRAGQGNYVVVDYFKQRLFVDSFSNSTITGYSRDTIQKENFSFYERILDKQERDWLLQMHKAAFKIFFDYPVSRRHDLEFFYDLISKTPGGSKLILQHKLVPLKLDRNGNMWLGLCFVATATSVRSPKACIVDIHTGDKYNFTGNKFELSTTKVLTQEEIMILKWMSKDVTAGEMCLELGISESSLNRKKKKIYELLGVQSATGAVYKAQMMGFI